MTIRAYKDAYPKIHPSAYVDDLALVEGHVRLGENSSIWPMAVIRGDVNQVGIGARTNIQDGSVLHVTHDGEFSPGGVPMIIGDDVTVGHHVVLHACTLESTCLIGIGSIIMDRVVIHERCMIGAGSLVTSGKELEGGYLWMGRPAKRIRPLTAKELKYLEYSAAHYVSIKDEHSRGRSQ